MTNPSETDGAVRAVKSAKRALDTLQALAGSEEGFTFTELISFLGIPKSSMYWLLQTMEPSGWVRYDDSTKRYRIGPTAWEVGVKYLRHPDLPTLALRHLRSARDQVHETIQLAVLDGVENVYVAKAESQNALRFVSEVGTRLPAYSTALGKVLLSHLSDADLRERFDAVEFVPFTARTIKSFDALVAELEKVRVQGYAIDDGDFVEGVSCVAVQITDENDAAIAAISCSMPSSHSGDHSLEAIVDQLRHAAEAISHDLGGRPTGTAEPVVNIDGPSESLLHDVYKEVL